jgi:flagellar biosynthesis GTPase FlhF
MSGELVIEEVMQSEFKASITVTELLMKTLENCAKDLASRCIVEAALRHGFDASEEIRVLGLENLALIRKQMAKKSAVKVLKEKKVREPKEKKSAFPMPFVAEKVDNSGCQGLAYNRGLFTQCQKKRMETGLYCKGCQTEADKNASGCPDCGTIEVRLATGLYEFKDPKGRSPVSYMKVLEKLKLTNMAALEESSKIGIEIPEEHFVVLDKPKKSKGRPSKLVKKTGAVEAENVTDLFAKLSAEGEGDDEVIEEGEDKPVKQTKAKLSDEEKAAKKELLEAERAAKKAEREAKLALEKAEREAKRKAEAEEKKAEREAKLAAEKAEREAKRAQEKAEREAKRAQEKAAKEAEKAAKGKKTEPVATPAPAPTPLAEPAPAPVEKPAPVAAPAKVSVTRIQIAGKAYLKSSTNILYDPQTKEEVGLWDPETKTIKDLPEEEEEEEEEEEYESDN